LRPRILQGHRGLRLPAATASSIPVPGTFSEQAVWDALRTCFDPEIPVNIVDLGLIYDLADRGYVLGRQVSSR
jgi:hypothetical protein